MDSNRGTVVHFDYGGYYSDGVVWNNKDDKIFSIVMKGTLEDVSYYRLVNRICGKLMVDAGTTKLRLSYIPLIVHPRSPSYILDDEDVLGYLMEVNQDQCRSLLHVELAEVVSEKQSNQYLCTNEELLSDGRVNDGDIVGASDVRANDDDIVAASDARVDDDGIVALGELVTIRQSSDMDNSFMFNSGDLDITPIERGEAVSAEREDGLNLNLGQEFSTKEEVKRAVERAMHQECFQIRTMETRPTVYAVKCRSVGCNWYLRASVPKNSNIFSVATYRKMHTCSRLEMVTVKSKSRGTPGLVASVLHEDYPGSFKTPSAKELVGLVHRKVGVEVSYSTARRGKMKAFSDVRGTPEEGFSMLPSYLHILETKNPGTVTKVKVDEQKRFMYLFIAVGACIEGFQAMRKVIIIDGTHLKTVYGGVLVIACAQDPDRHHYPLAFGVVDGEKDASWRWFLNLLKTQIPDDPELVFVSDRHQSIIKTVHEVYPKSAHGYCIFHLSQNVKAHVTKGQRKDTCSDKFRHLAQIYGKSEFKKYYADFRNRYPGCAVYLDESVHVSRWARSHFPGERYNIDTTNCVESMNNVLLEARKLPLLAMLDVILGKIVEWFNKYRKESAEVPEAQILVPHVHKVLDSMCKEAKSLGVIELNSFLLEYKVNGADGKGYVVDLKKKSCSCNHFDIDRYPCVHAIAVIDWVTEHTGVPIDIREYCSKYYWTEQWVLAYYRTVYPVPHHTTWDIPQEILDEVVLPKYYSPKKGRVQTTRHPSVGEARNGRKKKKSSSPWLGPSDGGESSGC